MTKVQLCTLLDAYKQKVANDKDRKLFAEAVRAAKASAPRAAYFTLWICCMASLQRRLRAPWQHDPSLDASLAQTSSVQSKQAPTVLVEAAQQHDLLAMTSAAKPNRLEAMQRPCRQAGQAAPTLEDFVADAFAVVSTVLYGTSLLACDSALEQALVLSRDINAAVEALRLQLGAIEPVELS